MNSLEHHGVVLERRNENAGAPRRGAGAPRRIRWSTTGWCWSAATKTLEHHGVVLERRDETLEHHGVVPEHHGRGAGAPR
jgi:hypothetical protein